MGGGCRSAWSSGCGEEGGEEDEGRVQCDGLSDRPNYLYTVI